MAAAVDGEVNASDEAGGVRRQESDALGHFIHLAWSAQRVGLLALGKKLNRGEGGLGKGGGMGEGDYRMCRFIARMQGVENLCSRYSFVLFFCNISKVCFFFLSTIANFQAFPIKWCEQGPRI